MKSLAGKIVRVQYDPAGQQWADWFIDMPQVAFGADVPGPEGRVGLMHSGRPGSHRNKRPVSLVLKWPFAALIRAQYRIASLQKR